MEGNARMGEEGRNEEVASSKRKVKLKARVKKSTFGLVSSQPSKNRRNRSPKNEP